MTGIYNGPHKGPFETNPRRPGERTDRAIEATLFMLNCYDRWSASAFHPAGCGREVWR